jgi:hypothetical protein
MNLHIKPNPSEYMMKRDIRHTLLAMLIASASLGALQQVHAAPGDPGEAFYGGGDKLLGGQDTDNDGYADPYATGGAARGAGLKQNAQNGPAGQGGGMGVGTGIGSTTLVNANNALGGDADGAAAGGGPGLKRQVRGRALNPADPARQTPDAAAQAVYGAAGKPAARKTTEIYRSPY